MSNSFDSDTDNEINTSDEELLKFIEERKVKIKLFGAGGAGSNTINRIMRDPLSTKVRLIALNTDAAHLRMIAAHNKVILGRNLTKGRGSGADPKVGEEAAKESERDIQKFIDGTSIAFITTGLGGGTGTGSGPYIASKAKKAGILTISVVTWPFTDEGEKRTLNAREGLEKLVYYSDCVIVIPNDKLLELVPDVPIQKAFKLADEIIMKAISGISDLITKPGLINLDFNDLVRVTKDSGMAMFGLGLSSAPVGQRITEATEQAVNSPFLDVDLSTSKAVIVSIQGGKDLMLDEAASALDIIKKKVGEKAEIIMGTSLDPQLNGKIQIMVLATGVKTKFDVTPRQGKGFGVDIDSIS